MTRRSSPNLAVEQSLALDQMASTRCRSNAPWEAPNAQRVGSPDTRQLGQQANSIFAALPAASLSTATRPIFGAEPSELSLLYVLFYIASSGDERNPGTFERNFNTRGGGQQDRARRQPGDRSAGSSRSSAAGSS